MEEYRQKVIDHFMNPKNVGIIKNPDAIGEATNPVCGEILKVHLKIRDDIVTDIKFQTFGCGASVATSSMITDLVKGKSIKETIKIVNKSIDKVLDHTHQTKINCSNLVQEAIKSAIKDYYEKNGKKN